MISRLILCLAFSSAYLATDSPAVVIGMLFVMVFSLANNGFPRHESSILVAIFQLIAFFWLLLSLVVSVYDVSPVHLTAVRLSVQSSWNNWAIVLGACQIVFLLSGLKKYENLTPRLLRVADPAFGLMALIAVVITSYIVNRGGSIIEGGYVGNTASYWSGMPTIFVASIAAWILLQKRYGFSFFIILNSVVFWWLFHANRSEVLAVFVFGNYLFLASFSRENNFSNWKIAYLAVGMLFAFVIFTYIGIARVEGLASAVDFSKIFKNVISSESLNVQTFGSSIYSAQVAVHVAEGGFLFGETYFGQILNSIPSFIPTPWERFQEVSSQYRNLQIMGGFGLLGEAYLNFGLFGAPLIAFFVVLILSALLARAASSFYASWFLLTLIFYSQRFVLYGYVYFHNILFLFGFLLVIWLLIRAASLTRGRNESNAV